ncbi:hypothetical protein OE265_07520 [Mycobacteroides abscessus]|uniref:phage upper tail fiber protein n=1 Tax=Mycobacteroides abscessus TaxID=36809 RepID=UPI0021D7AA75|nr:hypothetical protein [Mycobacteroides abscessus]MCU8690160.1 hypothetical protein [Mycobacteroides abscessus]MCU8709369.1 hypothetical protein [Mycobacteroides abscessus]MCU8714067.1 hypothetical protein [Mycobacteroides abscessus]MCU8748129.1 hypothetical protein [Mycobacteroides abscessus]MCU8758900.1 hypothetical protein [Mycobacteroides abscessus]
MGWVTKSALAVAWSAIIGKPSTFPPTTGTTAATACAGDDARLGDTRVPTDSSVTNSKVAANAAIDVSKLGTGRVVGSVNGTATSLTVWTGTRAQYDMLPTPRDGNTIYIWAT